MRLTRRGWAAAGVAVLAVALAWAFTPRGLNAVAAPLLVALVVGIVQVLRAPSPTVDAAAVPPGVPGDERTRTLTVTGGGLAEVTAPQPPGLGGEAVDAVVTLPATVDQSLTLERRGVYDPGDVTVRVRDSLGLVAASRTVPTDDEVVVYPETYDVGDHPALADLFGQAYTAERQAFDSLREYVPGDPLRNVHWKSSAKHDDYLVMQFAPDDHHETVHVVAEADPGRADEMASLAASIALLALEAGRGLELTVPGRSVAPGAGEAHREAVLAVLARTGPGEVDAGVQRGADVHIQATGSETTVTVGETTLTLETLLAGEPGPPKEVSA